MSSQLKIRTRNPADSTTDSELYDLYLKEAFGQYSDSATCYFRNIGGNKMDEYPRGTRVEIEISEDGGSNWEREWAGAVQDTAPNKMNGVPTAEVSLVGYDHFLRRREVYKTYTSQTVSSILEDLITQFTAVNWVPGNVSVQNDNTITQEFKGETVDSCIDLLASESANEEYGVNDDFEFFFRQQSISSAPQLTEADVVDYDLPEKGKEAINQYTLYYGSSGSESSVTVEDRAAQLELKDKLDSPRRVVLADSDTKTEVSSEAEARRIAEKRMDDNSALQTGTIQTFGRFGTNPGDIFPFSHSEAGFEGQQFRVAQKEFEYLKDKVTLKVAENVGDGNEDLLVSLVDQMNNVRARGADPSATGTRFLEFPTGIQLETGGDLLVEVQGEGSFVLGQSQLGEGSDDRLGGSGTRRDDLGNLRGVVTTAGIRQFRDTWQGEAATDVTHIGLGHSSSGISESDNSLTNPVDRASLDTLGVSGSDSILLDKTLQGDDPIFDGDAIEEIGFFDSSSGGNMYAGFWFDPVSLDSGENLIISATITLSTHPDHFGVATDTGKERARDLWIGETGHEPTDMVYGTGTTTASDSDTSLGNKVHEDTLDSQTDKSPGEQHILERIAAGEANGNNIAEVGMENSSDELLSRLVFEPYSKTSDAALETTLQWVFANA